MGWSSYEQEILDAAVRLERASRGGAEDGRAITYDQAANLSGEAVADIIMAVRKMRAERREAEPWISSVEHDEVKS